MLEFKIDIIKELDKKGWTISKIKEYQKINNINLIGQKTYYDIKNYNIVPGIKVINNLCFMLGKQPGSIIRYVPDPAPVAGSAADNGKE